MSKMEELTGQQIYELAATGRLREIDGGITWRELFQCENRVHQNALAETIESGRLMDIRGGMTADELAATSVYGVTGLHIIARAGLFDQVRGGVTDRHLSRGLDESGLTPLHMAAFGGQLDKIAGRVTAAELAGVRDKNDFSALSAAAWGKALAQIRDGVTAVTLFADASKSGRTALDNAAIQGVLHQIRGGIPADIGNKVDWNTLLDAAINDAKIMGIESCISGGASKDMLIRHLKSLGRLCFDLHLLPEDLEAITWEDQYIFQSKREVLKYARALAVMTQNLGISEVLPGDIITTLL